MILKYVVPLVWLALAYWVKRTPLLNKTDKGVVGLILLGGALVFWLIVLLLPD